MADIAYPQPPDDYDYDESELEDVETDSDSSEYMEATIPKVSNTKKETSPERVRELMLRRAQKVNVQMQANRDRITTHFALHHQQLGENATTFSHHGHRLADGSEESYARKLKLKVGEKVKLDFGWIQSPGLVVIENATKWKQPVLPTKEQSEAIEQTILYVALCVECPIEKALIVRPNNGFMFVELGTESTLFVETTGGVDANVNLFVLAK